MKNTTITVIMAVTILIAGCGKKSPSSSATPPPAQTDASPAAQPALTAWQQGDKAAAVSSFLAADSQITDSGLSQAQIGKIDKIKKDEGLRFSIHDHQIIFEPMGPMPPTPDWQRIINDIHEAIGDDFTNYTVVPPPAL
jgi:predicted small lipoprotein YifL